MGKVLSVPLPHYLWKVDDYRLFRLSILLERDLFSTPIRTGNEEPKWLDHWIVDCTIRNLAQGYNPKHRHSSLHCILVMGCHRLCIDGVWRHHCVSGLVNCGPNVSVIVCVFSYFSWMICVLHIDQMLSLLTIYSISFLLVLIQESGTSWSIITLSSCIWPCMSNFARLLYQVIMW